jgi:hypothetical protein
MPVLASTTPHRDPRHVALIEIATRGRVGSVWASNLDAPRRWWWTYSSATDEAHRASTGPRAGEPGKAEGCSSPMAGPKAADAGPGSKGPSLTPGPTR